MNTNKLISVVAVASCAIIPMAVNADTDGTVTIGGVAWYYYDKNDTEKTVTLGQRGSTDRNHTAMPSSTALDAANIPWTMLIDGENYTVTKVGSYAFAACYSLSGTLTIPETVTEIGERAFWACKALTKLATIGGVTKLNDYAFYYSNASDFHINQDFPDISRVTSLGSGPFLNCVGFTGEVKLNPGLTSIPYRCFENSGLTKITIPRSVTAITENAFMKTKLTAFILRGPADVVSGNQKYATINTKNAFPGCDRLKVLLFGKNTKGNTLNSGTMLTDVSGCLVFVPANGFWNNLVTGGDNNPVIYYGQGQELDIEMDDVSKTITATPTTVHTLTNVLNAATTLKSEYDWNTRISVTNTLDLTGVTIDSTAVSGVTFDRLMLSVKTQAQLNDILDTFPATTPISIDPTGLTENMVIPETYNNVYVKTVPGVTIKRTASGLMIVVK